MTIEDCDKVVDKLIAVDLLVIKRSRSRSPVPRRSISFEVRPRNAQAAQNDLSAEAPSSGPQQRVPSASPSSTIAADTPVFARAAGSRRIMAARAASPENAFGPGVAPMAPEGPGARMEEDEEMDNIEDIEGLSLKMGATTIAGHHEDFARPRRKRHFGLTLAAKPSSFSVPSFKKAVSSLKGKAVPPSKSKRS